MIFDGIQVSGIKNVGSYFFAFALNNQFSSTAPTSLISSNGRDWIDMRTILPPPVSETDENVIGAWEDSGIVYVITFRTVQGSSQPSTFYNVYSDSMNPGSAEFTALPSTQEIRFYPGQLNVFNLGSTVRMFITEQRSIFVSTQGTTFDNWRIISPLYDPADKSKVVATPTGYLRLDPLAGVEASTLTAANTWVQVASSSQMEYIQDLISDPQITSLKIEDAGVINGEIHLYLSYFNNSTAQSNLRYVVTLDGYTTLRQSIDDTTISYVPLSTTLYNPSTQLYVRPSIAWTAGGTRRFQTSSDGITWTDLPAASGPATGFFRDFYLIDGVYYFTAGNTFSAWPLFSTSDLVNFTTTLSLPSTSVYGLAFNGTTYAALVGSSGSSAGSRIILSSNGTTWNTANQITLPLDNFDVQGIYADNTQFTVVARNRIYTSVDGSSWLAGTGTAPNATITFSPGTIKAFIREKLPSYLYYDDNGAATIVYTADGGQTWLPTSAELDANIGTGELQLAFSVPQTGIIVRPPNSNQPVSESSPELYSYTYSTDMGNTWNIGSVAANITETYFEVYRKLVYDGNRYIFVVKGTPDFFTYNISIYESIDLVSWTTVMAPSQPFTVNPGSFNFFALPEGAYFYTESVSTNFGDSTALYYSTDLLNWESRYLQSSDQNAMNWSLVSESNIMPDAPYIIGNTEFANVRLADAVCDFTNKKVVVYSNVFSVKPGPNRVYQTNLFTNSQKPIAQPVGQVSDWLMRGTSFSPDLGENSTPVYSNNDFFGQDVRVAYRQQLMQVNELTTIKYFFDPIESNRHRLIIRQGDTQTAQNYVNWINTPGYDIEIFAPAPSDPGFEITQPTITVTTNSQYDALDVADQGSIFNSLIFYNGMGRYYVEVSFTGPRIFSGTGLESIRRMRYFGIIPLDNSGAVSTINPTTPILKISDTELVYAPSAQFTNTVRSGVFDTSSASCSDIGGLSVKPLYNIFAYSEEFDFSEEIFDNDANFITHYYWSARDFSASAPVQINIGPSSSQLEGQVWTAYPIIPVGDASVKHALYRQERMLLNSEFVTYFDLRPLARNTFKISLESVDDLNVPNAGWDFTVTIPDIADQTPGNAPSILVTNNSAYDSLDPADMGVLVDFSIREINQHSPGQTPWYRITIISTTPSSVGAGAFGANANVRWTITLLEPSGPDFVELFDATSPQPAHIELLRSHLEYGSREFGYQPHYSQYDYDFVQDPCMRE